MTIERPAATWSQIPVRRASGFIPSTADHSGPHPIEPVGAARPSPEAPPEAAIPIRVRLPRAAASPSFERASEVVLLLGERTDDAPPEPAMLAANAGWMLGLYAALGSSRRSAVYAARALQAIGAHAHIVETLPDSAARDVVSCTVRALSHPEVAVWSRAARALGRLAARLPRAAAALNAALAEGATIRAHAHAALAVLAPSGAGIAAACRRTVLAGTAAPADAAAYALGLPGGTDDDDGWEGEARALIERYGAGVWVCVATALREVARGESARAPVAHSLAVDLAVRVAGRVRAPRASAEASLAARITAQLDAVAHPESPADSPAGLVDWLCDTIASLADDATPSEVHPGEILCAQAAHFGERAVAALRDPGPQAPELSARRGAFLAELTAVLADGDLAVLAEHLRTDGFTADPATAVATLTRDVQRAVHDGLGRVDPALAPMRSRALVRMAVTLSSCAPVAMLAARDAASAARPAVSAALTRLADCAARWPAPLAHGALEAAVELAVALPRAAATDAHAAALAWIVLRAGSLAAALPPRGRAADEGPRASTASALLARCTGPDARPADAALLCALGEALGPGCALGALLVEAGRVLAREAPPSTLSHWAGLPSIDLVALAQVADDVAHARRDPAHALGPREGHTTHESPLRERAARLLSLSEVAPEAVGERTRASAAGRYVTEAHALCTAILTALGPLASAAAEVQLVAVVARAERDAHDAVREHAGLSRFLGRLKLGAVLQESTPHNAVKVLLADGPVPGRPVVVKIIASRALAGTRAELARRYLEREAQRLAALSHPNIVSIVDAGFVAEGAYLALEYIAGETLEARLRRDGPMPLRTAAPIVADVARALAYLHGRGVAHRDIKPSNVMLQLESLGRGADSIVRAVVIDLGIATEIGTALLAAEGIVGTPGYLPPEVVMASGAITPGVDSYALGVLAFEALAGFNPYLEGTDEITVVVVRHGHLALPLERLPAEAQREPLRALLAAATHPEPARRPSMRAFLAAWTDATR